MAKVLKAVRIDEELLQRLEAVVEAGAGDFSDHVRAAIESYVVGYERRERMYEWLRTQIKDTPGETVLSTVCEDEDEEVTA